ncbi:membrane protein [Neisseria arctica]|uniref:Outer-membrane lipoprotein LolB n=1 Tax=Neisseria arctica TaxID=1470200 RepID=A0A0J0YTV3_9NEIS|nr:lipoprotein insertase outer membrane protein LolB [Neisseria arctica]KLT73531.1 membrane protein [Neisseria arctica]UOO86197.1 lipoprotein localization factor LolB [Neisseria arctica]
MMKSKSLFKFCTIGAAVFSLAACAGLQPATTQQWSPQQESADFNAEGRLAVRMDGKGSYANFDWIQQKSVRTINVNTPLGNTLGQLCQDNNGVLAVGSDGRIYEAENASELSRQLLGFSLPLQYLDVWAAGQWVAGTPHQILQDGRLQQFGWIISRQLNSDGQVRILQLEDQKLSLRLIFDYFDYTKSESAPVQCEIRNRA